MLESEDALTLLRVPIGPFASVGVSASPASTRLLSVQPEELQRFTSHTHRQQLHATHTRFTGNPFRTGPGNH